MASTKAPLFGLDASGSLAKSIVFSKWRGRTYVRRHAIPKNPNSPLQRGMRAVFKYITQAWAGLTQAQKEAWSSLAATDNITDLNAQVRDAQGRARQNKGWRRGPSESAGTTPDAPTGLTVTGGAKQLEISWTRPIGAQGDYTVAVYVSETTGFSAGISTLAIVQVVTDVDAVVIKLKAATTYYVLVRETNVDGELGTVSSQGTAATD